MIGALAIKNRRKKMASTGGQNSVDVGPTTLAYNPFKTRGNLLLVTSGVCLLIGLIILIPAFLGNSLFFIYSASFFGAGLVIFMLACLWQSCDTSRERTVEMVPVR